MVDDAAQADRLVEADPAEAIAPIQEENNTTGDITGLVSDVMTDITELESFPALSIPVVVDDRNNALKVSEAVASIDDQESFVKGENDSIVGDHPALVDPRQNSFSVTEAQYDIPF